MGRYSEEAVASNQSPAVRVRYGRATFRNLAEHYIKYELGDLAEADDQKSHTTVEQILNHRHSLASFLVRKGTDIKTVQDMLRHSDVATTLGIYAHSMSEDRLAAQEEMLAAIMPHSNAIN